MLKVLEKTLNLQIENLKVNAQRMSSTANVIPINIEDEMKSAYIDYSMSVIVSRALPDVRDGLKPVHRRVLYGMSQLGLSHNRSYKKSARIVGEVLGKYHPHGDSSVYETMVRMAQPWVMRYTMVDGQGNFGSIDGDSPAAMRYTEARLTKIAEEMLTDIEKNTVEFRLNFDDTLQEPTVLPAAVPNLLVNGSSGIAVGMATNMPPHNLSEVIDGTIAYIDDKDIDIAGLMQHIKAPDFPTGGIIYGYDGVKKAFETGRGRVVMRARAELEQLPSGKERIIVTEIPYLVNKATMISKTAALVDEKVLDGISDIRDESDRSGLRIVYELKKDAIGEVILNKLYKYTGLQTSFSVNNIALVNGRPQTLNLKDIIRHFVSHRHEVVIRRTKYELEQAQKRAHILEGLLIALDHLDEVIKLIRASANPEEAKNGLMENFELSEVQAKAILDMRLQKLTGLERDKIKEEYNELMKTIEFLQNILNDEELRMTIIKDELKEIKEKYGDERKSEISLSGDDINIEDLIPNEDVIITITHHGYIKRTSLEAYRLQNRGGKGAKGLSFKEEDFTEDLLGVKTHNYLLFFTNRGKCHWLKVYEIPEGNKLTRGRPLQNLIQIEKDEKIRALITVESLDDKDYLEQKFILFATQKGLVKKTSLIDYSRPRSGGINAININEGDELLGATLTNGQSQIMLATRSGLAIRFEEEKVRSMGRTTTGVRGIRLNSAKDEVVGMAAVNDSNATILVVSENGYGKRSALNDYRITNRGGKGVKTMNISEKTGELVAMKNVSDENDLMIINRSGILIRIAVSGLREMGRATQGVKLIRLKEGDRIAAVAKVVKTTETEEELLEEMSERVEEAKPDEDAPSSEE